jgi:hypothetical protein
MNRTSGLFGRFYDNSKINRDDVKHGTGAILLIFSILPSLALPCVVLLLAYRTLRLIWFLLILLLS